MPASEGTHNEADDARYDGEQNEIDGHDGIRVLGLRQQLVVDPGSRHGEAVQAEEGGVYQEQQEGLVVSEPDTGG